jgi:hypothetical protein
MCGNLYQNTKDWPEHLHDGVDLLNKYGAYVPEVNEVQYAEIAFLLLTASDGDREALKKIASFIQSEHNRVKDLTSRLEEFGYKYCNWLQWAKRWTRKKTSQEVSDEEKEKSK